MEITISAISVLQRFNVSLAELEPVDEFALRGGIELWKEKWIRGIRQRTKTPNETIPDTVIEKLLDCDISYYF